MHAIVLAAGKSVRMGTNKLLEELAGEPLVRHAVRAALGSRADAVTVVTGNEPERILTALAGLPVHFVHNAAFATGMASSLRVGVLAAAADDARAAVVCLGDMPRITPSHVDALIEGVRR